MEYLQTSEENLQTPILQGPRNVAYKQTIASEALVTVDRVMDCLPQNPPLTPSGPSEAYQLQNNPLQISRGF